MDPNVREYLRKIGSKGGKARAKKHPKSKLREWGKRGGRPPIIRFLEKEEEGTNWMEPFTYYPKQARGRETDES